MSNYTQITFFAPKDSLLSGNPAKLIKGADVDPELAAIATAIASKYDATNFAFGIPVTSIGLTANNGSAATPMRSDASQALSQAIVPIWTGLHVFNGGLRAGNQTGELFRMTSLAARGSGNAYLDFFDTTGVKGYLGYVVGADDYYINNALAGAVNIQTQNATRIAVSSAGNVTVNAPSSGTPVTINGANAGVNVISSGATAPVTFTPSGQDVYSIGAGAIAASDFGITNITRSTHPITVSGGASGGNVTIAAPGGGRALIVNGLAGQYTSSMTASATSGNSFGLLILAGTNSGDSALNINNATNTVSYFGVRGDGAISMGPANNSLLVSGTTGAVAITAPSSGISLSVTGLNNQIAQFVGASGQSAGIDLVDGQTGNRDWAIISGGASPGTLTVFDRTRGANALTISSSGNIAIPAPSSGIALAATGFANSSVARLQGSATSGQSFGVDLLAGTTSADYALSVFNTSGGSTFFKVRGDGVVSGNDGTSLFELGYKDTPPNVQAGNYTLVASDRGKMINVANGATITIPTGVFSAGAAVSFLIGSSNTATLAQGAGLTLEWAGNGTATGNRTFTGAGLATVSFASGSIGLITGAGLT